MCGAPEQGTDLSATGVDTATETVIQGTVKGGDGSPVASAYVRLLDSGGEFTAEVVSSATGQFRFFAAPGEWTVRALHASGSGEQTVTVGRGVNQAELVLA